MPALCAITEWVLTRMLDWSCQWCTRCGLNDGASRHNSRWEALHTQHVIEEGAIPVSRWPQQSETKRTRQTSCKRVHSHRRWQLECICAIRIYTWQLTLPHLVVQKWNLPHSDLRSALTLKTQLWLNALHSTGLGGSSRVENTMIRTPAGTDGVTQ